MEERRSAHVSHHSFYYWSRGVKSTLFANFGEGVNAHAQCNGFKSWIPTCMHQMDLV